MAIDEKRRGEIALAYLKHLLKSDGFEIDQHFRRRVGNISKQTGIPFGELLEFSTETASEILAEVSDKSKPPTDDELEGFVHHGHGGGH